jgi:hypothetical protein
MGMYDSMGMFVMRQTHLFRFSALALGMALGPFAALCADPLDQQLLDDTPPKVSSSSTTSPAEKNIPAQPELNRAAPREPSIPRPNLDQPLDTRHPLTRIAGKMELVERRLSNGAEPSIVGLQRDIITDLDRLLTPGDPKNAGAEKEGNPKQSSPPQEPKQNSSQQPGDKQPAGKQPGQGREAPNGSGTGTGDNEPRKPTPRELMEATWGNLPARERERVFEAAGESFLPKYARSLRLYFERLAAEEAGK